MTYTFCSCMRNFIFATASLCQCRAVKFTSSVFTSLHVDVYDPIVLQAAAQSVKIGFSVHCHAFDQINQLIFIWVMH